MRALDKLRVMIDKSRHEYEQGNVSYVVGFNDIADRIEAEIAERYMELPVDADGVVIRVGDWMLTTGGYRERVGAVSSGGWNDAPLWCAADTSHAKPRTIEDVLREFSKRVLNSGHQWGLDAEETTAKYAAELRELMGGGE